MILDAFERHQIKRQLRKVNKWAPKMRKMSDEELKSQTKILQKQLADGKTVDQILPRAFAAMREADLRVLKMFPYDAQVMGAIVLNQGYIAEMKTGEGKTLTATMPVYLNAISGKGVHVITVNEYLSKRDATEMGQLYNWLGCSVGINNSEMSPDEKRQDYQADIMYSTNSEIGFDYLRDNMAVYKEDQVQRGLNYAIVDEVDSILIDEARTPLIISGPGTGTSKLYKQTDRFVKQLKNEVDYKIDLESKTVSLTDEGIKKAEKYFNLKNLYDPENTALTHHLDQALRANYIMLLDKDYVVSDGEVLIVDSFTGRVMQGRRFSDGLHQAIEAKEGVKIQEENKTMANITYQNLFRMYSKLAGMTGTAKTEQEEFREIYNMETITIPTNRPVARKDEPDLLYPTLQSKFAAVVKRIKSLHAKGQPILVGTVAVETSEYLSHLLDQEHIPHVVLNAKNHAKEADIIKNAGQRGAVTIATNMAGRGTDIKLGPGVRELGGLAVIGTERHESRRIDNQLRGRSGRQGDPGLSQFYLSLEDDLMRLFGSERLMKVFTSLGVEENEQIEHKMLSNAIEKAQEKIEFNNFGIRKNLLDYDQVNNEQREIIYEERRQVLDGENMRDAIYKMITDIVDSMTDMCFSDDMDSSEWDLNEFNTAITPIIPIHPLTAEKVKGHKKDEIKHIVKEEAVKLYEAKEAEFPEPEQLRELERVVLLKCIDSKWMDHIDDMEMLRQGIGLMAYGQRDPVVEYKMNAFEMFNSMISSIQEDTVRMLYHVHVEQKIEREQVAKVTGTNKDDSAGPKKPVQRKEDKVYPNDPCPCGSGKKYKQCCGRKAAKI